MKKIALVGNPNVGKSTLFNTLTNMHQHTGNWPGKTVEVAKGTFKYNDNYYEIIDLPGTYSLLAHSEEEEIARNYVCFEDYDYVLVICDAMCLERNLNLVLQVLEITNKVIICVNLINVAQKNNIDINLLKLEKILDTPVVGINASNKKGVLNLLNRLEKVSFKSKFKINYPNKIENTLNKIEKKIENLNVNINSRWLGINLINDDQLLLKEIEKRYKFSALKIKGINSLLSNVDKEDIPKTIVKYSERIANEVVNKNKYHNKNVVDKIVTSRFIGIPIMILLLFVILWITIKGANYPSSLLFDIFMKFEPILYSFLKFFHIPNFLISLLVNGVYKVLTWVIAVMLPPMAIFFPLFTLLEDLGYLPRIAFNLDRIFCKCKACGKQALTMCMGFGCNAVGVCGARIIDSKRERLIAILTNVFVPCNGRFPTMIAIITIFLVGYNGNQTLGVLLLTMIILLGFLITFIVSYILSKTLLKGYPSSFVLELPAYRKPQIKKVLIRSLLDRTLFVLGRAIVVAAPAGIIIWLLSNININNISLLSYICNILNPFANIFGMDGKILLAFILGFPANEIVIPILIMAYTATNQLVDYESIQSLGNLLILNGWTIKTAICVLIFSLCHFPCSTTCLTIKKETGSNKWTLLSIIIPTLIGLLLCLLVNIIFAIF